MSDDRWRRTSREDDPDTSEFGGPLFPDDPADEARRDRADSNGADERDPHGDERRLRFGPDDTGPLPHWTDPPTGEVPRLEPRGDEPGFDDDNDEVDVWSTFTTESPVVRWGDDDENMDTGVVQAITPDFEPDDEPPAPPRSGESPRVRRDPSGGIARDAPFERGGDFDQAGGSGSIERPGSLFGDEPSGSVPRAPGTVERGRLTGELPQQRRDPGRITIGTDPSGMPRRAPEPRRRPSNTRSGRPLGPARTGGPPSQRDMTAAIIAGAVIAAVFIASLFISPAVTAGIAAIVLGIAGWEYFGKVTEKGYRPAVVPGLVACTLAPVAGYFEGERAIPLVLALAFVTAAVSFIGTPGVESGPLPNMAVTTMGIVWIGILGAFAGAILSFSWQFGGNIGTDTMFMIALGVAANDIGALMVGSAVGRTPLRAWVSPSKTVEGLIGGTLVTFFALFIAAQIASDQNIWSSTREVLLLALLISVLAPLGDLTESMFKRNLEIKDFGSIVQGHGGVLDRFDGFLFVLPGAYYLMHVL